jgi:TldD protein
LVNGAWGFTAFPSANSTDIVQLAQDAVAQAKVNAQDGRRVVDLHPISVAVGTWTMPVRIDPFTVPVAEKLAVIQYWMDYAEQCGVHINAIDSKLHFIRQERVVATSDGAHFTQTVYESGGRINVFDGKDGLRNTILLGGLDVAGVGWELALDANIPEQLRQAPDRLAAQRAAQAHHKPAQVGRYTVVCDGVTMANILDRTIGVATQLDRAMGYEANASGTSFLNDPLNMLGVFKIGSPLVTVTANRSAPKQLATVKWDDEGVEPKPFALVQDGVLVDYQTTREQAAWLASYYQRIGRPVQSHGCAASENAECTPMQHMPNLALTPRHGGSTLDELVANVSDGILVVKGQTRADFQARTGLLLGEFYEIKHGKIGPQLVGGGILYDTVDFWRNVTALGDSTTQETIASTTYPGSAVFDRIVGSYPVKGEPPQRTSYSVQAVAAVVAKQAVIDPQRKA